MTAPDGESILAASLRLLFDGRDDPWRADGPIQPGAWPELSWWYELPGDLRAVRHVGVGSFGPRYEVPVVIPDVERVVLPPSWHKVNYGSTERARWKDPAPWSYTKLPAGAVNPAWESVPLPRTVNGLIMVREVLRRYAGFPIAVVFDGRDIPFAPFGVAMPRWLLAPYPAAWAHHDRAALLRTLHAIGPEAREDIVRATAPYECTQERSRVATEVVAALLGVPVDV